MKKRILYTIILAMVLAMLLVACTEIKPGKDKPVSPDKGTALETSQELKKFNSAEELKKYLENNLNQNIQYGGGFFSRGAMTEDMAVTTAAPMEKSAQSVATGSDKSSEYSQTNVQVQGVDEADFIKNDGKYIYAISQDKLVIVDSFPAENSKILSKTDIDGQPVNMFVNKDRLVVFSILDDESYIIPEYGFAPEKRYSQRTHAYIYDISDKEAPKLVKDYSINGYYDDARMIDNYVYFIAKDSVYYYNNFVDVPVVKAGKEKILTPDIYYFDNPEYNYVFHTIASFNIQQDEDINAKTFLMGYSNNLYVSLNNIYINYQKNLPWRHYQEENQDKFYKVVVPLLPQDAQSKIKDIKTDDSLNSYEKWQKISSILEDMYNNMEENEKEAIIKKINEAMDEYETKVATERSKTIIQKIAIDEGKIEYKAKGEVPGYLLNQFSLDEDKGNLRVATTTDIWTRDGNKLYNNVYILDEEMNIIGKLEEIAPDERIYSTRFIGDRLYMVTFKRIDPLFVIDLSDETNPRILGELEIPGFSDYLHPYDETHIIGIGKETGTNEWGGVSIKGLKLALFDVSDVENPKEIANYEIGISGTDSEALHEHKAFLFDKKKELLVIPVREVKEKEKYDSSVGYYRQRVWQGAYVFNLNPQDGFELKGKISHNEGDEDSGYYWGSPYAVRRSLFMDDILYTVSAKKILMNDLEDIDNGINSINLPFKQERYYPVYY